jgi:hypothetical protein
MPAPITEQRYSTGKVENYNTYAHFKPADPPLTPNHPGPGTFKFPLDDITTGTFWTRLVVNAWRPVRAKEEMVPRQTHKLNRHGVANIWLPMPTQLATAYNQNFTETENMMVSRGSGIGDLTKAKWGGSYATLWDQIEAVGAGIKNELYSWGSSIMDVNNSGKMNLGSVMNQHMGLVYDGASLRKHTLSWKMTPKSKVEQIAINKVVFALKKYSAPILMGPLPGQGEVYHSTSEETIIHNTEVADAYAPQLDEWAANPEITPEQYLPPKHADVSDSLKNIGRLGIPATINVEFWFGGSINPNLFQIKDSFIESVEVNYTPSGTWNAHEDGAPIQTEVTLSFKENAILSIDDIHTAGGY